MFESIANEFLTKLNGNISCDLGIECYITGSLLNHSFDEFSNINIIVAPHTEQVCNKVELMLKKIGCDTIGSKGKGDFIFEYKGVAIKVIISSSLIKNSLTTMPLKEFCSNTIMPKSCIRFIDYYHDKNQFKDKSLVYVSEINDLIIDIIVAFKRNDRILLKKNVCALYYSIVYLSEYVTKNGIDYDNNRATAYLHSYFIEELSNITFDNIDIHDESINSIFEKLSHIIHVFNILLYQLEQILQCQICVKGINRILQKNKIVCIVIKPISDECLTKYNRSLSKNYDLMRDDAHLSKKILDSLGSLMSGKNVFEIGVGTGIVAEKIISIAKSYTGLDNSEYMLKEFKDKCNKKGYGDITFILGDMMQIDKYLNIRYDIYLERAALMFCLDPIVVVDKLIKGARKGAAFIRLYISDEEDCIYKRVLDIFNSAIANFDNFPIVLKEYDEFKLVDNYLIDKGYDVERKLLFEWDSIMTQKKIIDGLLTKSIPYMQKYSDEAVTFGVSCVKKYLHKIGIEEELTIHKKVYAYFTVF